jgi:hypothetical protein
MGHEALDMGVLHRESSVGTDNEQPHIFAANSLQRRAISLDCEIRCDRGCRGGTCVALGVVCDCAQLQQAIWGQNNRVNASSRYALRGNYLRIPEGIIASYRNALPQIGGIDCFLERASTGTADLVFECCDINDGRCTVLWQAEVAKLESCKRKHIPYHPEVIFKGLAHVRFSFTWDLDLPAHASRS